MAFVNPNKPAGLSPVRYLNGARWSGKGQIYSILAADTNPYFPGDVVKLGGSGDTSGIPNVTLSTSADTVPAVGVIMSVGTLQYGAYASPNNLNLVNRPTGAQPVNYYALVEDDPNIIWEVQETGAVTNLTQTAIGLNAQLLYAAPATGVNVSGTMLDNGGSVAPATTLTFQLKILRLAPRIDNHFVTSPATGGGFQKWWVLLNNHQFRTGIVGL